MSDGDDFPRDPSAEKWGLFPSTIFPVLELWDALEDITDSEAAKRAVAALEREELETLVLVRLWFRVAGFRAGEAEE
jgi:hypothetical protein